MTPAPTAAAAANTIDLSCIHYAQHFTPLE